MEVTFQRGRGVSRAPFEETPPTLPLIQEEKQQGQPESVHTLVFMYSGDTKSENT